MLPLKGGEKKASALDRLLKCDIVKCFDRIPHDRLLSRFANGKRDLTALIHLGLLRSLELGTKSVTDSEESQST